MNHDIWIEETFRLARAVNRALIAAGCVHRLKDSTGSKTVPVPLERTRYDPDAGFMWVEINSQRLPRGFSFSRLCEVGFQEKVIGIFHRRVKVMQYERSIIVASLIKLPARKSDTLPMAVS